MAESIFEDMEKAPTESNLSITNDGDGKSPLGRNLLRNSFVDSIPNHDGEDEMLDERDNWGIDPLEFLSNVDTNNEWKESKYENLPNTATDSFFKAYDIHDIEKENGQRQMKHKDDDRDDKQPNKKVCKTKKFEAIKYSLGPNEEYIAVRRCEYNTWERNEDSVSQIYQEIFQKRTTDRRLHALSEEKLEEKSNLKTLL
ncbi:hypothetical protein Tco_0613354 [Tanacetum coccineum]